MIENKRLSEDRPLRDDRNFVCFFRGEDVKTRMDDVRNSIHYVRDNWSNEKWHEEMRDSIRKEYEIPVDKEILRQKNWIDVVSDTVALEVNKKNFDLIKYYTSSDGYEKLKGMNDVFRIEPLDAAKCNLATYLVELINIELYNYIYTHDSKNNFEGTIYRGFNPTCAEAYGVFEKILNNPIEKRQIAIPLEFMSASFDKNRALFYSCKGKNSILQSPILLEITVRNLDKSLLDIYHNFYPESPVTSLCSVPIEKISSTPSDKEVLLRGAFFQVMKVHLNENPVRAELVMLNANRDHIKTHKYRDTNAQNLFRCLVKQNKMRVCKELSDNGEDRKKYEEAEKAAGLEIETNIALSEKEQREKII